MEKISNNSEIRTWRDHIPLDWKYTAGVAGERFLQSPETGKNSGGDLSGPVTRVFFLPRYSAKTASSSSRSGKRFRAIRVSSIRSPKFELTRRKAKNPLG